MNVAGDRFDELRELCTAAGDNASLAIAMAGLVADRAFQGPDPRGVAAGIGSLGAHRVGRRCNPDGGAVRRGHLTPRLKRGEWLDVLRWSQRAIDLADGDPSKGNFIFGSPLALALATRGSCPLLRLGRPGWRDDLRHGPRHGPQRRPDVLRHGRHLRLRCRDSERGAQGRRCRGARDRGCPEHRRTISEDLRWPRAERDGRALVHRETPAERDRGQKVLGQVSEVCLHGRFYVFIYRSSTCTPHVRGPGAATATVLYLKCAPP